MDVIEFHPIVKRIRWGGRRLGTVLGKPIGSETDYAESWEIADHRDGQSVVASGEFAGWTLRRLIEEHGDELLGSATSGQFPLLIKFLDATDRLSLQVHPNDEQAKSFDPHENGKTEAWVIIDAQPGSCLYAGLQAGVDRETFKRHLEAGTVEECLHKFPVSAGDCVFVPAGTVHAIGEGVLLAEVQQQSNLTFRLHDWGYVDAEGNPRETHIQESLACTDFDRGPVDPVISTLVAIGGNTEERLVDCAHFQIRRLQLGEPTRLAVDRFQALIVLGGAVRLVTETRQTELAFGQTALIPAAIGSIELYPHERATILLASVPV